MPRSSELHVGAAKSPRTHKSSVNLHKVVVHRSLRHNVWNPHACGHTDMSDILSGIPAAAGLSLSLPMRLRTSEQVLVNSLRLLLYDHIMFITEYFRIRLSYCHLAMPEH